LFVECREDCTVGANALIDFAAQLARHQRFGFLNREIVQFVLSLAADLEHVTKSGRRDQPGQGAAPFDERIGEQGRRVYHALELGRLQAVVAQNLVDSGQHGTRGRIVRGEHLAAEPARGLVLPGDDIGEGAANVDAE